MEDLIPVKFDKVMPSRTYTCIVLGNDAKKFAIYTDIPSGKSLQMYLTGTERTRPSTHDLIQKIFWGLEVKIRQIVINELEDTIFFARIYLEQKVGELLHIVEIDARPSDCILLALIHKAPLLCHPKVFEQAIPIMEEV